MANLATISPVAALAERLTLRANSLIITIFGDAVLPRGGTIWLSDLIALSALFGLSERIVRTAVYRLSKDGWLSSASRGRRSSYSVAEAGLARFREAEARIYGDAPRHWDGQWCLVHLTPAMEQATRRTARRELKWLGFGQFGPTLLAHPSADTTLVRTTLEAVGGKGTAIIFRGDIQSPAGNDELHTIVTRSWNLNELNMEYEGFIANFSPLLSDSGALAALDEADCFALRILLIHDYRRILLKDPRLPARLLPDVWRGGATREMCRGAYRQIADRADSYLLVNLHPQHDRMPPLAEYYRHRFGGLK